MKNTAFIHGQSVGAIWWGEEQGISLASESVVSITVCMEPGQMAGVPWFVVEFTNGAICKYNGAKLEGVEIKPKSKTES